MALNAQRASLVIEIKMGVVRSTCGANFTKGSHKPAFAGHGARFTTIAAAATTTTTTVTTTG
jgi:hypothetical protein